MSSYRVGQIEQMKRSLKVSVREPGPWGQPLERVYACTYCGELVVAVELKSGDQEETEEDRRRAESRIVEHLRRPRAGSKRDAMNNGGCLRKPAELMGPARPKPAPTPTTYHYEGYGDRLCLWAAFCEWLERQPYHAAYRPPFWAGPLLRTDRGGVDERRVLGLIFWSTGHGWRLRKEWQSRLRSALELEKADQRFDVAAGT